MKASTGSKVLKALQLNYRRPKENGAKCDDEKELKLNFSQTMAEVEDCLNLLNKDRERARAQAEGSRRRQ